MDEAAGQAASRNGVDVAAVLWACEVLRLAWGDFCMFGRDDRGYWAAGRVGTVMHRTDDPGELGGLLAGFFEAEP